MITGTCILCFSSDMKVFNINKSALKYTYEKLSGLTVNSRYNVCYICCTRLQQFTWLLKVTESLESDNHQVEPHPKLTLVNVENGSIPYHIMIKQEDEIQVKVEKLSDNDEEGVIDTGFEEKPDILNNLQANITKLGNQKLQKTEEYICDVCSKKYTNRLSLRNHKRIHMEGSFICKICGAEFTLKTNLTQHMIIHSNYRPYACNICSKRYKRSDHLKHHKLTHSNMKPFACEACGMRFSRDTSLRNHKALHTNKVYICDICNVKCNRKGNLKIHILGHYDRKIFKCKSCQKTFKNERTKRIHLKRNCPYR